MTSLADEELVKMDRGLENLEFQVIRQHSETFIEAITDITPLANRLQERSLIDIHTYRKVTEGGSGHNQLERATEIVKVLEKTISVLKNDKKRQEKFEQILSIFSEFTPLNHVVDDAKEAYGKLPYMLVIGSQHSAHRSYDL